MSQTSQAPSRGWTALVLALGALLFTWPLVLHPLLLGGHPHGETDNHLWMMWRAIQGWLGQPGPWANYPQGLPLPIMDPVNLPLALPGALLDPVLGYNGMLFGNVLLGMAAGYWLALQFVGPRAAWSAAVALGCSPFLSGEIEFGITESWPLWLLALHVAFLWRYQERGRRLDVLGAGLCLGGYALSGWYAAFFALVAELAIVPWWAWRSRRWAGFIAQGALAALITLPSFIHFLGIREFWGGRWHWPTQVPMAHLDNWRCLRNYGTDALNLVLPSLEPAPISHSVYLGLGVLALAAIGLRAQGRRALGPLVAVALLLALALGHWVRLNGQVLELASQPVQGPARMLLKAVPPLVGLSHWYRAVGPATVFLALLAAMGAQRLLSWVPRQRTALGLVIAAALLAESLAVGQTRWPRMQYDPRPPAIYAALEQPGAILELPFDNGRMPFSQTPARIYNRWQPFHGRPVAESYESRDAILASNRLIAVADAACGVRPTRPKHELPPAKMRDAAPLHEQGALERQVQDLADAGFAYVILHRDRAPSSERAAAWLERSFGPASYEVGEASAWRIRSAEGTTAP